MEIISWFVKHYPAIVKKMKETEHSCSELIVNPFHAEGSVWTHTMMVYSHLPLNASIELRLAALLHDIGKPDCLKLVEDGEIIKSKFSGHENLSSFMSIDILSNYITSNEINVDIENILKAINFHTFFHKIVDKDESGFYISEKNKQKINRMFSQDLDLYTLLLDLSFADSKGRIGIDQFNFVSKYELLYNFIPYEGEYKLKEFPHVMHMMVGLPGSGKSTKLGKLLKENPKLKVYSIDDEIVKLGKYSNTYDGAWTKNNQKEAAQILLLKIEEAVKNKEDFIVDATNFTDDIRFRRLAKLTGRYEKIAHVQLASEEFIKNSMNKRKDKIIPYHHIYDMAKHFRYPNLIDFHQLNFDILITHTGE